MHRLRRTLIIVGVIAGLLATATPVRATVIHTHGKTRIANVSRAADAHHF